MKTKLVLLIPFLLGTSQSYLNSQIEDTIVFSNHPIEPGSPSALTHEFQSGDHLYALAKLEKSVSELCRASGKQKADVEVFLYKIVPPLYSYQQPSEEEFESCTLTVSGESLLKPYLMLDLVPDPASMSTYGNTDLQYKKFGASFDGPVKFAKKFATLESGTTKILVRVQCNYEAVAEGIFTLQGEDFSMYTNMSTGINDAASGLKTQGTVMPKAVLTDKKLEKDLLKAIEASQTYKERIKGKILQIVITDADWILRRNELTGAILNHYIRASIAVQYDDKSCKVWPCSLRQDYVSGKFQETVYDGTGDPYPILFENISK